MKITDKNKMIIGITCIFILVSIWFMFGRGFDFSKKRNSDSTVMPEATTTTEAIDNGIVVEQSFINTTDTISEIGVVFYRIQYLEGVNMVMELYDGNKLLASSIYPVHMIEGEHRTYIVPNSTLTGMKNKDLKIRVFAEQNEYTGLSILVSEKENASYKFGNSMKNGSLCFSVTE